MIIDHAQTPVNDSIRTGPESWLYVFSPAHALGVVSAAELFVFVSGFVMGMLYQRFIDEHGLRSASVRIFRRALKLYLTVVGLTVVFILIGLVPGFESVHYDDPVRAIARALTLRHDPSRLLLLYLLLVASTPLVFLALRRGWTLAVIGASILCWTADQLAPTPLGSALPIAFDLAAWQLVFVAGLVLGWHRRQIAGFAAAHPRMLAAYAAALVLGAVTMLAIHHSSTLAATVFGDHILSDLYDFPQRMPAPRLLAAIIFLSLAVLTTTYLFKGIEVAVGWLLIPLGEAALYVYTLHLFLVYVLLAHLPGFYLIPEPFYGFALLGLVLVHWGLVKKRFLFFLIPR
jgi:hypothetical protein